MYTNLYLLIACKQSCLLTPICVDIFCYRMISLTDLSCFFYIPMSFHRKHKMLSLFFFAKKRYISFHKTFYSVYRRETILHIAHKYNSYSHYTMMCSVVKVLMSVGGQSSRRVSSMYVINPTAIYITPISAGTCP